MIPMERKGLVDLLLVVAALTEVGSNSVNEESRKSFTRNENI